MAETTSAPSPDSPMTQPAPPSAATVSASGQDGASAKPRSGLKSVALPNEHGGWGLTTEPVLLGLLVKPGVAGLCLGLAAVLAFLARTPLKVVLVDTKRGRSLDRTRLAKIVLLVEVGLIAALAAVAVLSAGWGFWWPLAITAPLVLVELSYDVRSRSRRLIPELAGAVGIGGVVALIVLAGGADTRLAVALWLILAARAITAIVTVRGQVMALHGRAASPGHTIAADLVAIALVAAAVAVSSPVLAGAIAVVAAVAAQRLLARVAPAERAVVLGVRQMALGIAVVVITAIGVLVAT